MRCSEPFGIWPVPVWCIAMETSRFRASPPSASRPCWIPSGPAGFLGVSRVRVVARLALVGLHVGAAPGDGPDAAEQTGGERPEGPGDPCGFEAQGGVEGP